MIATHGDVVLRQIATRITTSGLGRNGRKSASTPLPAVRQGLRPLSDVLFFGSGRPRPSPFGRAGERRIRLRCHAEF